MLEDERLIPDEFEEFVAGGGFAAEAAEHTQGVLSRNPVISPQYSRFITSRPVAKPPRALLKT